jgi:predicted MPP superfamily phosphohydrolase
MRIAHISDLHLRHHLPGTADIPARQSRLMPDYFARALQQIRALQPDLLVLSGDLVDYPLDRLDDPTTRQQGRQDLADLHAQLGEFPAPVALVAGNHDDPPTFAELFGTPRAGSPEPTDHSNSAGRAAQPKFPSDQTVAGYRVLTFHDAEGPNHVPQRVGSQANRFRAALSETAAAPQIHIQHYLVWPERNADYPHTYGTGADMAAAITASGNVRLVLSGHYHPGVPPFLEKGTWFAVAPAFAEAPHPFWLYDLDDDRLTYHAFTLAL